MNATARKKPSTHPELDQTIPACGDNLARLVLEPFVRNNDLRMALET